MSGAWCVVRGGSRTLASTVAWRSTLNNISKLPALRARSLAVHPCLQLDQRTTGFLGIIANGESLPFRQVSQPSRNHNLAGQLATRPDCYLKELREFTGSAPSATFGDVGTDRDSRSSHLRGQTEPLVPGKPGGQNVDRHSKFLGIRPASELPEVLHKAVILGSAAEKKWFVGRRWCVVGGAWCVEAPNVATSLPGLDTLHLPWFHHAPRTTHHGPRLLDAPRTTHHAPRVL